MNQAMADQALAAWADDIRQTEELRAHPNSREVDLPPRFVRQLWAIRRDRRAAGMAMVGCLHAAEATIPTTTAAWALNVAVCRYDEDALDMAPWERRWCDVNSADTSMSDDSADDPPRQPIGHPAVVVGVGRFVIGTEHLLYRLCADCLVARGTAK